MQYSRPVQNPGDDLFWGDPMPFYHAGVFHLFILLDHGHHADKGGLGGHQWAHFTTTDLEHWEAHPLAVPVGEPGSYDQYGICTGSVIFHDGVYYAFYATRKATGEGWSNFLTEQLCFAASRDGIHFAKDPGNPLADPAAGYGTDYRDPCVFRDPTTGLFHMLVTARRRPEVAFSRGGCLAHLTSSDLRHWELQEPFLEHHHLGNAPECSDWFAWNGWYYLLFAHEGMARYRMSRFPLGPWTRPAHDTFEGSMASVMKTAAWKDNRRIGAAFVPWRRDGKDDGARAYAGNVVLRELVQDADGTLHVRFLPEVVPSSGAPLAWEAEALVGAVQVRPGVGVTLDGNPGAAIAALGPVPVQARIRLQVRPAPGTPCFGLCLRAEGRYERGYELRFAPHERRVSLRNIRIPAHQAGDVSSELRGVAGLDTCFSLDIVMTDDILDVCVAERHCLIQRFPEVRGDRLCLFCEDGSVAFSDLTVQALTDPPQSWLIRA